MAGLESRDAVLIAGGGIAGLAAALALARSGFRVRLFDQAPVLEEVGAGLQLSPNATDILARLGVLERLLPAATRIKSIVLRDAASLRAIAEVPLGDAAERRWGAPYLAVHRADLQATLLSAVAEEPAIAFTPGARVTHAVSSATGARLHFAGEGGSDAVEGMLAVGADGVWSRLRGCVRGGEEAGFTGRVAWRATIAAPEAGDVARAILPPDVVTAFLHRRFHLVAYPLRAGSLINLVAIARGKALAPSWAEPAAAGEVAGIFAGAAPALADAAARATIWTRWPLHEVSHAGPWSDGRAIVLAGDAAHAMSPFAAQGAAMAIEDAAVLAHCLAHTPGGQAAALKRYETLRKPRIGSVRRRGALNRFAWNAAGPFALGRDIVLSLTPPKRLARGFDWLYGWKAPEFPAG